MTTMKEIQKMKDKELVDFIEEKRKNVQEFRFNAAARDVRSVRTAKKEISRALTELNTRSKTVNNAQ